MFDFLIRIEHIVSQENLPKEEALLQLHGVYEQYRQMAIGWCN